MGSVGIATAPPRMMINAQTVAKIGLLMKKSTNKVQLYLLLREPVAALAKRSNQCLDQCEAASGGDLSTVSFTGTPSARN